MSHRFLRYSSSEEEFQKAIEMAAKMPDSTEMLKKIYLAEIDSYVELDLLTCEEEARQAIDGYMALDEPNAKVYASLAVVKLVDGDKQGAIKAFQASLGLDEQNLDVRCSLLEVMFQEKDYDSIMSQIEHYGPETVGIWLRDRIYFSVHNWFIVAAHKKNNYDLLIKCYEHGIESTQVSQTDDELLKKTSPERRATVTLEIRSRIQASSSMLRCYLALVYHKYLGDRKKAFELWSTAFFHRSEFMKLVNTRDSFFSDIIIPQHFAYFAQMIYEEVEDQISEKLQEKLALLERLRQVQEASRQIEQIRFNEARDLDILLSQLYLRLGRRDEAQKILTTELHTAIAILQDDIDYNDSWGWAALAHLLFVNGQSARANLATSMTRFNESGYDLRASGTHIEEKGKAHPGENAQDATFITQTSEPNDGLQGLEKHDADGKGESMENIPTEQALDGTEAEEEYCSMDHDCVAGGRLSRESFMYTCMTCFNVQLCEECHNNLVSQAKQVKYFVCSPKHEFIKSPMDGLESITGDEIIVNGQTISVPTWLDEVQQEWTTGRYFSS